METKNAPARNSSGIGATRRTVLKGAAWSVPAIAAASAAPLASASPNACQNGTAPSPTAIIGANLDWVRESDLKAIWTLPDGNVATLTLTGITGFTLGNLNLHAINLDDNYPFYWTLRPYTHPFPQVVSEGHFANDGSGRIPDAVISVTMTFERPVESFSFTMSRIHSEELVNPPFTRTGREFVRAYSDGTMTATPLDLQNVGGPSVEQRDDWWTPAPGRGGIWDVSGVQYDITGPVNTVTFDFGATYAPWNAAQISDMVVSTCV